MAAGDPLAEQEALVRALPETWWDSQQGRATTEAFRQTEVSVSRLAVLSYDEIVAIFKKDLTKPGTPPSLVKATGTIAFSDLCAACEAVEPKAPVVVTAVEDPVKDDPHGASDNPSHALVKGWDRSNPTVPRELTRGMANNIRKACEYRPVTYADGELPK